MTRRRKAVFVASCVMIALLVMATRYAAPLARPALGYVAKTVCSDVFVGGATTGQSLGDLPSEPIARVIRTKVDEAARTVRASIPLVATRTARARAGLGCTLDPLDGSVAALPAPAPAVDDSSDAVWPDGARVEPAATPALLAAIDEAFTEPDSLHTRDTRAIVIVRGGRIIAEKYAPGYSAANRFTGWSMTKSVTSALAGILVGEGRLSLAGSALREEWRDARGTISLHHLLQMSSGLAFDESYTPDGGATRMLFAERDAAATAANSPLVHPPGTHWEYSSATTNIIAGIIRSAIGDDSNYASFPRRVLFDRIGMHSAVLEPDPSGTFVGSSFMYATARDWARFGLLFLRDGVWNGKQILPMGWVRYSVTPATAAPLGKYGAQWWLNAGAAADSTQREWPTLPRDVYWASGFNGQYVVVLPSYDMVVVRLGDTADDASWDLEAFLGRVIAAVSTTD